MDTRAVVELVARLPVQEWRYEVELGSVRHIGPTSEDFYAVFGLGDSAESIGKVDADGVALAAIQGLYELAREQQAEIESLVREIAELRRQVRADSR